MKETQRRGTFHLPAQGYGISSCVGLIISLEVGWGLMHTRPFHVQDMVHSQKRACATVQGVATEKLSEVQ